MARVTEPLASPSLKVLSFESALYVLMDGRRRYHERDKSYLGGPAYTVIVSSFLTHSHAESDTTQIYLQATPPFTHT